MLSRGSFLRSRAEWNVVRAVRACQVLMEELVRGRDRIESTMLNKVNDAEKDQGVTTQDVSVSLEEIASEAIFGNWRGQGFCRVALVSELASRSRRAVSDSRFGSERVRKQVDGAKRNPITMQGRKVM